jgi:import inner membrane translocase subunit TIM17
MYYPYLKILDNRSRFIHSVGDGFIAGGAYGCVVPFIRGFRSSPSGARLAAGAQHVFRNAPRHAGWMVAWSAVYFSVDTAMSLARRREDIWNPIAGGAVALASLNMHRGARAAALCAPVGAAVITVPLGIIWYASEWDSRFMSWNDTLDYLEGGKGVFCRRKPIKQKRKKRCVFCISRIHCCLTGLHYYYVHRKDMTMGRFELFPVVVVFDPFYSSDSQTLPFAIQSNV